MYHERLINPKIVEATAERGVVMPDISEDIRIACQTFVVQTLRTKGGILALSDGKLEEIYPWGASGAMGEAERLRLLCQELTSWGEFYRDWHETMPLGRNLNRMAIIGASGSAEQVQHVLEKHPKTNVVVIEIDPKKAQMAEKILSQTHRRAVENQRVVIVNKDATKYLPTQPNGFSAVWADKVFIHSRSKLEEAEAKSPRQLLYEAIETALVTGGILHFSDVLARGWSVQAAPGFVDNPSTTQNLEELRKLMGIIVDASWTKRGALLWESIEDMITEPTKYAPTLKFDDSRAKVYKAPYLNAKSLEGMISQIISVTPSLGIEAARRRQPDNQGLIQAANGMWKVAERFSQLVNGDDMLIALPLHSHFAYVKE